MVIKFSILLTRWQQLAVPSFRGAEDKTATGLVAVEGLARLVTGAHAGIPLVSRQASTVGKPIGLDITLCDRGKRNEKWAGLWGWVSRTIPNSWAPQLHPPIRTDP